MYREGLVDMLLEVTYLNSGGKIGDTIKAVSRSNPPDFH